ncbi:hypothetical protein ARMSODRAFT_559474 [Armillaria solidipes]|uniref:Cytochrome P450 n=1 Tax=Armillaria solidipes TaxID=1076256 RepID=A0A2H3BGL7_9AGAR|nr:hypothetical protein ARMSODRAFT_559474 [Armillaria solidipes]
MLFFVVLCVSVGYCSLQIVKFCWRQHTSFLRLIPGPKEGSFIFGNLREVLLMKGNPSVEHEQWLQHCGPTLSLKGFFGVRKSYFVRG